MAAINVEIDLKNILSGLFIFSRAAYIFQDIIIRTFARDPYSIQLNKISIMNKDKQK